VSDLNISMNIILLS